MKQLKILGLAAMAVAALMATLGAGTASATVFCDETKTPCPVNQDWPKTAFDFELKSGVVSRVTDTFGLTLAECKVGTMKGTILQPGSKTETVIPSIPNAGLTWEGCNMEAGTGLLLQVHQIALTDNGTVTADTVAIFKVLYQTKECWYQIAKSQDLGALIGGKDAVLAINVSPTLDADNSSPLCPGTVKWTAEYTLKEPNPGGVITPLYVEDE